MLVIVLFCEFDLTVFSGLGLVPVITGVTVAALSCWVAVTGRGCLVQSIALRL